MATIKQLNERYIKLDSLFTEYGLDDMGASIRDYVLPDRGRFSGNSSANARNRFEKNSRKYVIDDITEQSANMLVGGFSSMLTPQTSPWVKLGPSNKRLSDLHDVAVWFDDVTEFILRTFAEADIYSVLHSTYLEFIGFGTGAQMLESDEINVIRPVSFTFGEYRIATNGKGKVDTWAYQCYMYAHELETRFGKDAMSPQAKRALKSDDKKTLFKVRWIVEPNDGRPGFEGGNRNFISYYWEADAPGYGQEVLEVRGFDEFPLQVPRWSTIANDTYGKECPGQKQLSNTKMLQSMCEDYVVAVKRMGDPPMVSDGSHNFINTLPSGISEAPNSTGGQMGIRPLFDRDPNIEAILSGIQYWREIISKGFFNDLLLVISGAGNDRKTATEIIARNEEKYGFLGHVLDRVFNEHLKPMVTLTFNIAASQGYFDPDGPYPMPEVLVGEDYDISFTSLLAQAQEAIKLNQLDRFLERAGMVASLFPDALDRVDEDAILKLYGEMIPARALRSDEQVGKIKQAKAEAAAAQAQMEAMQATAGAMKDMSAASTEEGSVLSEVVAEA